jgi:hypothetical protein
MVKGSAERGQSVAVVTLHSYKRGIDTTKFRRIESPKIFRHKNIIRVMNHRQSTMPVPEFVFLTTMEDDDDDTLSWLEDEDGPGTPTDDIRKSHTFGSLTTGGSRVDAYSQVNDINFAWETRNNIGSPLANTTSPFPPTNVSILDGQSAAQDKLHFSWPRPGRLLREARSLSPEAPPGSGKLHSCPPKLPRSTFCRPPKAPVRQPSKESHASSSAY